jgi:hypothetical protein
MGVGLSSRSGLLKPIRFLFVFIFPMSGQKTRLLSLLALLPHHLRFLLLQWKPSHSRKMKSLESILRSYLLQRVDGDTSSSSMRKVHFLILPPGSNLWEYMVKQLLLSYFSSYPANFISSPPSYYCSFFSSFFISFDSLTRYPPPAPDLKHSHSHSHIHKALLKSSMPQSTNGETPTGVESQQQATQ